MPELDTVEAARLDLAARVAQAASITLEVSPGSILVLLAEVERLRAKEESQDVKILRLEEAARRAINMLQIFRFPGSIPSPWDDAIIELIRALEE